MGIYDYLEEEAQRYDMPEALAMSQAISLKRIADALESSRNHQDQVIAMLSEIELNLRMANQIATNTGIGLGALKRDYVVPPGDENEVLPRSVGAFSTSYTVPR